MRLGPPLLAAALVFGSCRAHAPAAEPEPSTSLVRSPPGLVKADESCPSLSPYAELDAMGKSFFSADAYEAVRQSRAWECRHFTYDVDGLAVSGWLVRPRPAGSARLPVIYFARGGTGDFGKVDALDLVDFALWAQEGFAVMATDYRFVGPRARLDEWGGADLNDLLRLADVAREVDGLDPSRAFLAGRSRGGTMVYLALKRHLPVRAAAVIGGVSDPTALASQRPELAAGDEDYDGWARLWPAWEERRDELLRERSAVAWPERSIARARSSSSLSTRETGTRCR